MSSTAASSAQRQTPQYYSRPQFSTPDPNPNISLEYPVQVQSVQRNVEFTMQLPPVPRTPLPDVDSLLHDAELTGWFIVIRQQLSLGGFVDFVSEWTNAPKNDKLNLGQNAYLILNFQTHQLNVLIMF